MTTSPLPTTKKSRITRNAFAASNASEYSAITTTFTNLKEKSTAKMISECFTRQFAENATILLMEMLSGTDFEAIKEIFLEG